jgi:exonuclease VII small subunit
MALVSFCEQKLNEVQKKVELILEKKGGAPKEPAEEYSADEE